MFFERRRMKRKVVKSFPMLLALFLVQVLLTVGGNVGRRRNLELEDSGVEEEEGMKCVCDGSCEHLRESDCPWGLTLDVCGCCFLCARGENEPCAGAHGTCAIGLRCQITPEISEEGSCTRCTANKTTTHPFKKFGCNVSGGKCICEEKEFGCPDEKMFLFDTEESCRSRTVFLIDRKDLEPKSQSVSATGDCGNIRCPQPIECPPDSYRHPIILKSNQETCCPSIQDCLCNPGLICPPPLTCPLGWIVHTVRPQTGKPGQCCPHYECIRSSYEGGTAELGQTCIFKGETYPTGRGWLNHDDCSACVCRHGVTSCNPVECGDVHPECAVVKTLPGSDSCCPVCAGCMTSSGILHNNTDVWQEDPCTTCECSEGRIKCHAVMCAPTMCLNPILTPGECCPRCTTDDDESSSSECSAMECGDLECPYGFRLNAATGCPICECISCPRLVECSIQECKFGFETNEEGCPICSCRRRRRKQEEQDIHVHQSQEPGTLLASVPPLPFSVSCVVAQNGISHQNGEEWLDKCRRCICKDGLEMCSLISCSPAKCEHPILYPGSCCPRCPEEFLEQHYSEGQGVLSECKESSNGNGTGGLWNLGHCLTCTCHNGQVLCSTPDCPPTPCSADEIATDDEEKEDCCLKCRTESRILSDKNSFTNSTTKQNCFSDDSLQVYEDGESWKVVACESCICEDGQIHCFSPWKCPPIQCERPILAKNQCCPICLDGNLRMTTTTIGPGPKEYLITSQEDINLEKNSFSPSIDPNCIVIISLLLCVFFLLGVYIIRTYFHRRQCRLAKEILFNCSNSSATLRDSSPECCYNYPDSRQLCEQKTPLHPNEAASRDFNIMLHTDKL